MENTQKSTVIIWMVVSVVILGGVFYFFSKDKGDFTLVVDNSKEESRLLVLNAFMQKKITSHPPQCLSWKEVESSGDWITWDFTKEWKTWNSFCPALSPDADVPYPTMRAKVNLQTKEVLFQALDGVYR